MSKEVVLPWELKYNYVRGMLTTLFKGFMYEIREEFGAATALKIYEKLNKRNDRIKRMTKTFMEVFKLEGNDAETIGRFLDIYTGIIGSDSTTIERSKTISRARVTKCAWKTEPTDISSWCPNLLISLIVETINPEATIERPKGMCAGDPYCEWIFKTEE